MRITNKMIFSQAEWGMIKGEEELLTAQERVTTGRRILKPSDDPSGVNKVMGYKTLLSKIEQYGRNLNAVRPRLEQTESAMASAVDVLQRLKELAVAQANGTMTADDRKMAAAEVQQLFGEMVSIANTEDESGYIFAGYAGNTPPFQSDGSITAGISVSGEINIQIDSGARIAANIPGDRVFKGTGGGIDIFAALNSFISALNSNDVTGIQTAIANMDTSLSQVINARTDIGARLARVEMVKDRLDEIRLATTEAMSNEEDIDLAKAISDFTAKQQALEAARASAAKVFEMPTLMDFLK